MKALVALEELIQEGEARLKMVKKQISAHESGENKLSKMGLASSETAVEDITISLEANREALSELLKLDIQELDKQEKLKEAVKRKNYFHYQKTRIRRNKTRNNDEKLEAMSIMDELPEDFGFEDKELFNIAEQSLKMNLTLLDDAEKHLTEIKKDFIELLKDLKDEEIKDLELLNYRIPILVLGFSTLISNIKENREKDNLPEFKGLPKYEDWWIQELWKSHQAYMGLYKWREIIFNVCKTTDQQKAWNVIYRNWISIKTLLGSKGMLAYKYTYAFDTVMRDHCGLEEELATTSLDTMKTIIGKLTQKEDFSTSSAKHAIITPYVLFKRKQINYQDVKGR